VKGGKKGKGKGRKKGWKGKGRNDLPYDRGDLAALSG